MSQVRKSFSKPFAALLAISLLAAQLAALAHAYEHDPGASTNPVCSTCIAGQSLSAACVDSATVPMLDSCRTCGGTERLQSPHAIDLPTARQRAPPVNP